MKISIIFYNFAKILSINLFFYKTMKKLFFSSIIILSTFAMNSCKPEVITPEPPEPPEQKPAKIVINEVYSRGETDNQYGEFDWVELYNDGDLEGDVSGFKLYDEDKSESKIVILPEGTKIAAKGFLLVEVAKATETYDGFGLGSGGDKVFLLDNEGVMLDSVAFGALSPDEAFARKPDGSTTFAIQLPTPNASNNSVVATPMIINISHQPVSPTDEDNVVIIASIFGDNLTKKVVEWKVNDVAQTPVTMEVAAEINMPNAFKATISAQAANAVVEYTIVAENSAGARAELSGNYTVRSSDFIDYTGLVINEIDGNGKFIEFYNSSANAISLAGVTLVKNEEQTWWTGDAGLSIAANGRYTIAQQGGALGADVYSGASGISPKKTLKFELKQPDCTTIIDQFARVKSDNALDANCTPDYGQSPQYSFSRCPDGGEFGLATPSCNSANPATAAGQIVTN